MVNDCCGDGLQWPSSIHRTVRVSVAILVFGEGGVRDNNNTENQNRRAVNSQAKGEFAEELIVSFGNAVPCPWTVLILVRVGWLGLGL